MENQKQENEPEKGIFDADIIAKVVKESDPEDIKTAINNISAVSEYVKMIKRKNPSLMRYFDDKIFVIIGVVVIATMALFMIPDPSNILMSIVSGLFGMASGRALDKDNE